MPTDLWESPCLVAQRTGKRCRSCLRDGKWRDRYKRLRAAGLCVRCYAVESVRGVFCQRCYDIEYARREKRRKTGTRLRCACCFQDGHMAKTCPARTPEPTP